MERSWIGFVHASEAPVFPIAQGIALALAVAVFARRPPERALRTRTRSARVTELVAFAAGALAGCALLGPLLRLPRTLAGGRIDPFAPGWPMAWGALLGATLGVWIACRAGRAETLAVLDRMAPALGVLVLLGRLGCFFSGCCFGKPTGGEVAVTYPAGTPAFVHHAHEGIIDPQAALSAPVHPTSLYEALSGAAMIVAGVWIARRARPGAAFISVAALYAAARFALEVLRGDVRPAAGPLSLPQWISLVVLAGVLWAVSEALRAPVQRSHVLDPAPCPPSRTSTTS